MSPAKLAQNGVLASWPTLFVCCAPGLCMMTLERQKEKIRNYLAFDSVIRPMPKSNTIIKEITSFGECLLLTLGPVAHQCEKEWICKYLGH